MQKNIIYIVIIVIIFISGFFFGQGSTKGTLDRITDNLQSAENRVSSLESTISGYRKTVEELERIRLEQEQFIDKIKEGFDNSRESVKRIESGADRGSEIIEELFKEINNQ